ncbi:thiamine pyrophosphate-dependent enzyme [Porticoccus sp. W117]|uniref:thiamine pyrophosphate-dependent enzyme n=1 Tax=Porticoccus sp. W117 TaxID=3054777 RepID=UPI00259A97FC|nr:thiamine pyrophosphate-dependent enzyme [Porticoccus sp. W117]MDM3870688.1 thiamine pyrophosphate-dependent enzyme [Porticoccus sp. W117]
MGNRTKNRLHIPDAPFRPGDKPDFSHLDIGVAGSVERPPCNSKPMEIRDLAYNLVRVLDDDGVAHGDWNPNLNPDVLREGLRTMLLTRKYDERMFRMQRQAKMSFYLKCTGEEAVAVASTMALQPADMLFPTYRQQGAFIARGADLFQEMMCQVMNNELDPMQGKQLPIKYSSAEKGFFSISGPLTTHFPQAVGWAMAAAYKGEDDIALAWTGDGSTAEGDFHYALQFAATYRAPCILTVVNNQWAISSPQTIAGGENTTFAARGIGYGLPALRVDGNDFLAVYAATQWAAERARAGLGSTLIELYTYRVEGHSTSDDPTGYRPRNEPEFWPLGDPIERLKDHLIQLGEWSQQQHDELAQELEDYVTECWKKVDAMGNINDPEYAHIHSAALFEQVYKEMPPHLRKQRQQLGR